MGIRLESIIATIIGLILVSFFLIKVEQPSLQKSDESKELTFTDTRLIEVDTKNILSLAHSRYGEAEEKALTLSDIVYHTDRMNLLRAQKGRYQGDYLYLEGNVTLNQKEGFDYRAQKATYNKKRQILTIDSLFEAQLDENTISGENLVYDVKKKKSTAYKIKAVLYTFEK